MITEITVYQTIERKGKYLLDITEKDILKWHKEKWGEDPADWPGPEFNWQECIEDYVFDVFHDTQVPSDGIPLHERKFSEEPDVFVSKWDDFHVELMDTAEGKRALNDQRMYHDGTNL